MTVGGILASLFPLLYLIGLGSLVFLSPFALPVQTFVAAVAYIYLLPLIIFRLHGFFFPVLEGDYDLSEKRYNPWWTGHMLQYPFIAVPFLESLLHFVPGLYSMWLRAWGSKIGQKVFWTPRTEILDRNLVHIGDSVLVGHMSIFVSHLVEMRNGAPTLVLKCIRIEEKSFLGADAQFGPGAYVPAGSRLKPKMRLFWKGEWK